MEKHDVVVVGAGHAGLRAGLNLAKAKKDVLVLDKKAHDIIGEKICCGGLTSRAIKFVPEDLIKWKCKTLLVHLKKKSLSITSQEVFGTDEKPLGASILRHEVGQWYLKQYEEEGGQLLAGTAVKGLDKEKNEITLENGDKIGYKYLIAADGSTSTITKLLGFKSDSVFAGEYRIENYSKEDTPLEVFIWPERIGYTYCWIMPYDKGRASVGVGGHPKYSPQPIQEKVKELILEEKGIDLSKYEYKQAPYRVSYHGFRHGNIFLTGDAASFGCTLTGEGQYPAFVSADIASKAIIDPKYNWKSDINDLLVLHRMGMPFLKALPFIPSGLRDVLLPKVALKVAPMVGSFNIVKKIAVKVTASGED